MVQFLNFVNRVIQKILLVFIEQGQSYTPHFLRESLCSGSNKTNLSNRLVQNA